MSERRSSTPILWQAVHILSREIHSEDGVANSALLEAAQRLEELYYENQVLQLKIKEIEGKKRVTKVQRYKSMLAELGCVICRRDNNERVQPELHHIAEGSGQRSDWLLAPLCINHHRIGSASLHGAGVKRFLSMHRLSSEFHLLELVNKFRAEDGV